MNNIKVGFILKKIGQMIIVMIVLSMFVFGIARLCPGDPLQAYYGDSLEHMNSEQRYIAKEKLGLNESIPVQYIKWVNKAIHGDWGISYKYKQPVTTVIGAFWKNTLVLGGLTYLILFWLAMLLGRWCALHEGKRADRVICRVGVISASIPAFFMAIILILVFSINIPIFPVSGSYSYGGGGILDRIFHLILPVTVLVLEHLWYYTYMIRNKLIEETRQEYVLLCKAKGIPRKIIMKKQCMRNIMPSMLTIMAIAVPHILGGTYVVEMVFSYPGLGVLSFEAAKYQDYNMLMALCLITGVVVLVFNIAAQIINEFIDPRMSYERMDLSSEDTLTEVEA